MSVFEVKTKSWGSITKIESRQPIIDVCRKTKVLAKNRDYYGLSGKLFTDKGTLEHGCEYDHLVLTAKIMRPQQYHSVELRPEITAGNIRVLPHLAHQFTTGDIGDILYQKLYEKTFRPGLIGLDTTSEPKGAVSMLCDIMDAVNYVDGPVVVAFNTILWHREYNRKHTWGDVTRELNENGRFALYYREGWSQVMAYDYVNGGTTMGTLILIRKGAACSD